MVTFGGGALDRAALLRGEARSLEARADARFLLFWKGKPMHEDGQLVRVAADHPILKDSGPDRIFLGRQNDQYLFAADLSLWTPEDVPDAGFDTFLDASVQRHPAKDPPACFAELRGIMTGLSAFEGELASTARGLMNWHRSHRFCAACGGPSVFSMGGWQRDCPSCGAKHFPRTDPVVIMLITHGNDVLMGRSPGWPEGMYSLLAGFVEPGESFEAAVRREVLEETRIVVDEVRYLACQPWPFPNSLMLGCWGRANSREITIDPVEIEAARWVGREEMVSVFAGQHPTLLPARRGAIAHFLLENWLADTLF